MIDLDHLDTLTDTDLDSATSTTEPRKEAQ